MKWQQRSARATPQPRNPSIYRKPHRLGCNCQHCQTSARPSEFVRWVQHRLNGILGLRLNLDGLLSPATRSAIRSFQQRQGLPPDGLIGPPTRRALEQPAQSAQSEMGNLDPWAQQSAKSSLLTSRGAQSSASTPRLISQEQTASGITLYLEIDLGIRGVDRKNAKHITGVFIPTGLRSNGLNLILYLHGIKTRADLSINGYWSALHNPHFALREALTASGRQAILVAPTLGPRSQRQVGSLIETGGLDAFLAQVLAGLAAYAGLKQPLSSIVLTCHSGGGFPMRKLAMATNQSSKLIRECWGFDCTYFNDDPDWLRWAKANPQSRLYLYYLPGSATQTRALYLARKRPNLIVQKADTRALKALHPSTIAHNLVPLSHFGQRLSRAEFL